MLGPPPQQRDRFALTRTLLDRPSLPLPQTRSHYSSPRPTAKKHAGRRINSSDTFAGLTPLPASNSMALRPSRSRPGRRRKCGSGEMRQQRRGPGHACSLAATDRVEYPNYGEPVDGALGQLAIPPLRRAYND